jgi:broad specificity phosphatase PhoE
VTRAPITYVRHAMPHVEEGVHPSEWHLDAAGRAAAAAGADGLEIEGGIGVLVTSTEPKAQETAAAIAARWGAATEAEPRLREATRPWIGPGYRAMAHRYLRGDPLEGWEAHAALAERVRGAVDDAIGRAGGRQVVVVSHGLALAVHLGERLGPVFDRESFWSGLAFPDAWVLDENLVLHRSLPGAHLS